MSTFSEATTGNCGKSFWTDYEQTTDIRIRQPFYHQWPRFEKISLNTFQSPYGPIGTIDTNALIVHRNILLTKQFINTNTIETKVHLIKSYLDMDDSLINCAVNAGAKGIVIEAMGRGNLPPRALSGVNYALENNVVVVIVSRCPYGRVMESYGYEGGGKDLTARGVILGGELNGQKARLKLMVSLGYTNNIEEIKDIFKIS